MPARVRLIDPSDDERLASLLTENREFLAPWDPVRPDSFFTVAGQRSAVTAGLTSHGRGESMPLVILDDGGDVVGRITLSGIVRGAFQSCAMGYWVARSSNGRGYASEAVASALQIAFGDLGLHRVQAETLMHNIASQKVLARNGFERFGLAPQYLRIAGRWQDHLMFQRLADRAGG